MQAPFWSQGLNRYSYVFNDPTNLTDPSGFSANGEDSTIGFASWGAGVTALAALEGAGQVWGTAAVGYGALGGTVFGVGNVVTSFATGEYKLFDAHEASSQKVAAPTATAKSSDANPRQPVGAASENTGGPKELARTQNKGGIGSARRATPQTGGAPSAADGQRRVDAAYSRSGLDWGKPPRYNPSLPDYGWTGKDGVEIGPPALRSDPLLRSTIVHEGVHVGQLKLGNYPHWRSEVGAAVSEAEAYREELLLSNIEQTGLSQEDQEFVAGEYKKQLLSLEQFGARGDYYLRQILINQDFSLLPQDVRVGAVPGWIK